MLTTTIFKIWCYFRFELFSKNNNKCIIFNSFKNNLFSFNAKYLFLYLRNKGFDCYFIINDETRRLKLEQEHGKFFITSTSYADLKKIFTSGVWITSTGLPIRIPFASKNRELINLWHGIPLKKIGKDEHGLSFIRWCIITFIYRNQYSVIPASSEEIGNILAACLKCPQRAVRLYGQPQNDIPSGHYPEHLLTYRQQFEHNTKKKILYCPTYRENLKTILFPFDDFDLNTLDKYCEDNNICIYIRTHHMDSGNQTELYSAKNVRQYNMDVMPDIMEVLDYFDMLITDYSSIFFDFLLTDKPMLFLPYDKSEYKRLRGFYFDYDAVTPGPKPDSFRAFLNEINTLFENENYYKNDRHKVKSKIHPKKLNSCELIERYLINIQ